MPSDRNRKTDFADVDARAVLEKAVEILRAVRMILCFPRMADLFSDFWRIEIRAWVVEAIGLSNRILQENVFPPVASAHQVIDCILLVLRSLVLRKHFL